MNIHVIFNSIPEEYKEQRVSDLVRVSTPRPIFYFLTILSVIMATCGLLIDNAAIIIASMLIAPLLLPFLSLSLSVAVRSGRLLWRSLRTIAVSVGVAFVIAALVTWILRFALSMDAEAMVTAEVLDRARPSVVYFIVAVIAGCASSIVWFKEDFSDAIAGTAIAVALIPPLATVGIGTALWEWEIAGYALGMFMINMLGIVFAATGIFLLVNVQNKRSIVMRALRSAENRLSHDIRASKKRI